MKKSKQFIQRGQYFFDRTIASGVTPLLLWLAAITIIVLVLASTLIAFGVNSSGKSEVEFLEAFWTSLGIVLKPKIVTDPGWGYRVLMLGLAVVGILIVSVLIGVLTSGIAQKLNQLRRGRSTVIENNHTLILGWSAKSIPILKELIIANENINRSVVVVLADMDKVEMERIISTEIPVSKTTRIICRRGDPTELTSLEMVSSNAARSFILLRGEFEEADDDIIKAILALRKICGGTLSAPLVAEIVNSANATAAVRIDQRVSIIDASEIVIRIIAQSTIEPGVSGIYEEILSFEGNEIYFQDQPNAVGKKFYDICLSFDNSIIIGIVDSNGNATLNPPSEQIFMTGEQLIAISEDDDKTVYNANSIIPAFSLEGYESKTELRPKKILVIGWHQKGQILHREFDALLPDGSEVYLIYDDKLVNSPPVPNTSSSKIKWDVNIGDTTARNVLDELNMGTFSHIVVLSYRDLINSNKADSKTLLTLIHLRDILEDYPDCSITSELINSKHRELVESNDVSDFVASENLASKALVQISENWNLNKIFQILLTSEGNEFHIRSAEDYGIKGENRFLDISKISLQRGEIAVGYRNGAEIIMNPNKLNKVSISDDFDIIVLAEN